MIFNIGDKVTCINEDGWDTVKGETYTINHVNKRKYRSDIIRFDEIGYEHLEKDFELAKQTNEI